MPVKMQTDACEGPFLGRTVCLEIFDDIVREILFHAVEFL